MQIISNDLRNDTVQDSKGFNSQSLATQAKKGRQLVSMMPVFNKAFDLLVDDFVELSTENFEKPDRRLWLKIVRRI